MPGSTGARVLEVTGLSTRVTLPGSVVRAVGGVDLHVDAGETLGVVGESGCGKTTVGKMLVALERPNSGSVLLGGADVSALGGGRLRLLRRAACHFPLRTPAAGPAAAAIPRLSGPWPRVGCRDNRYARAARPDRHDRSGPHRLDPGSQPG